MTYNFAPAAPDEEFVYGACRPCHNLQAPSGSTVDDWIHHMQENGVKRVVPLLDAKLDRYDDLLQRYRSAFGTENILHMPIHERTYVEPDVLQDEVLPFLDQAVAQKERTVIHCSAGVGRTGHLLVAWLVYGRDMDFARAIDTVSQSSRWADGDVYRNPTEAGDRGTLKQIINESTN